MALEHVIDGGPGHQIQVGRYEGRSGGFDISSQGWARCECGWSAHDIMFNLTNTAALDHATDAVTQAKAARQEE